ncbi:hypothetical protein BMS3Abin07_01455 [bacterium BMS3Abin07]|nr:hypothetical protein BMS3Abin07_01455 [bacterium BMS3Abin07]GBE33075.1 hypothetical protein BMS3Bbin05_02010 [bacterium BMS3Bbin05]HDO23216.1 TIGR04442 family protein [Nitrospirota bacterium]HDZ87261.1 TIGR04442 family protein [Nitrospirota bacterium]
MINELRIHGTIGPVEFFTYVSGSDVSKTIFYEETPDYIRFFSRGNEFVITTDGIRYKGCGGGFCEYMFGVDKPTDDTLRDEVVNRLTMFGTYTGKDEKLEFTDNVEGSEIFYRLFLQGHAVQNYYFIVSSDFEGSYKKRQRVILKSVGKYLKRTSMGNEWNGTELVRGFMESLHEEKTTVFIIKLIHRNNHRLYSLFQEFYLEKRYLDASREMYLKDFIDRENIDEYQIERIRIDVMYRHPDNKMVVDEYRDILIDAVGRDQLKPAEIGRLKRLRTLAIRNNIPEVLFDTIDDQLLKGKKIVESHESDYLKEARGILETLFFKDPGLKKHIITEDVVKLLKAKYTAHEKNEMGFERLILDIGKMCDEIVKETEDFTIFEELSRILTYFDRYDNTSSLTNAIAFTEKFDISGENIRSLIGNKEEFDSLKSGLFEELFISPLLVNKYLTSFGRRRVKILFRGLKNIITGDASIREILHNLKKIADEEKIYQIMLMSLNERIKDIYPRLDTKTGRAEVRMEIDKELAGKRILNRIPVHIFEKAVIDIKKEVFYINHVFPKAVKNNDSGLREDFLENSGLDRFYVESKEREYLKKKGIPYSVIDDMMSESAGLV